MTIEQKDKISILRHQGMSYSQIAIALGVSENTVSSYCKRNNLGSIPKSKLQEFDKNVCRECGKPLHRESKGQPKKFCSEQCRRKWWKANETTLAKKAYYVFTCASCGKEFESYGNKNRKFCGHACYIAKRFNEGGENDATRVV